MSEVNTGENQEPQASPLGMSDDEFASIDPSDFPEEDFSEQEPEDQDFDDTQDADDTEQEDTTDDGDAAEDDAASAESSEASDTDTDENEDDTQEQEGSDESQDTSDTEGDDEADETTGDESDDTEDGETDTDADESAEVDYKSEYEKVMAPFRANGKEMQAKTAEEAVQLMQMGANYNKKMAALKPSLKTLKLLENNELLDEEKLSYLIDLDKKNPDAIKKLIKESGIDPMEIDVDAESDYKPNTYTVDDRQMELDEVLDSIQDTPTYSQTINVVSNKWDAASKQTISNNPQLLEVINDHMASGIYEQVSNVVERERTLGRLKGLSDLEAYRQVGDALHAKGQFEQKAPVETGKKVVPKRKTKTEDPTLKRKKRAASSTKTKPAAKAPDFNPLGMSDDDFEKQFNESLL